jgi:enoyl-CoA hydratase
VQRNGRRSARSPGRLEAGRFETLDIARVSDGVAVVTLDRPEQLNSLTQAVFEELAALAAITHEDRQLRALVITGRGRAFCAGGDYEVVAGLGELTIEETCARLGRGSAAIIAVRHIGVPVIAAVNGAASGGGLALALAADIRMAAEGAVFVAPFLKLGISACDVGVSWMLPRIVGLGRASEMMLTGRRVGAAEAREIGLVTSVVEPDRLDQAALELAEQLASNGRLSLGLTKEGLQLAVDAPSLQAALALEIRQQALTQHADEQGRLRAIREQL